MDHRFTDGLEWLRTTGPEVENARLSGVVEKPQIDVDHISDIDEVATLHARFIAIPGTEQAQILATTDLGVVMISHTRHLAFVLLTRTIDVEVAEAHHLAGQL